MLNNFQFHINTKAKGYSVISTIIHHKEIRENKHYKHSNKINRIQVAFKYKFESLPNRVFSSDIISIITSDNISTENSKKKIKI